MLKLVADVNRKTGLTAAAAEAGIAKWGPNVLPSTKKSLVLVFLAFLWGPMPCAIWIAAAIEL